MLNWINLILLVISTALMAFFYIKSVEPAALEQKIGLNAYARSAYYRITASIFEIIVILNYILYFFLPVSILIPRFFFWDYWISLMFSLVIFFPSLFIMLKMQEEKHFFRIKNTLFIKEFIWRFGILKHLEKHLYGGVLHSF